MAEALPVAIVCVGMAGGYRLFASFNVIVHGPTDHLLPAQAQAKLHSCRESTPICIPNAMHHT